MRQIKFALLLLLLTGCCCCKQAASVEASIPAPTTMPAYAQLVEKHNDRVKDIHRFWARAVIEVRWVDAEGSRRFEQGDGHLILDLPKRSSLTLGKVSVIKLRAGSNDTHFWLFDGIEEKKLYLGRHDGGKDATLRGAPQKSPLPLRPVDLPRLLGILPIAAPPAGAAPPVGWDTTEGAFVIEPPGEHTRYFFNPISSRVVRVDLLNPRKAGQTLLSAVLTEPERIESEKTAVGPYLNKRIRVTTTGQEGSMTLHLSEMTDAERKVNPRNFDLDYLIKTNEPTVIVPVVSE